MIASIKQTKMKKLILTTIALVLISTFPSIHAVASNPRATTSVPLESSEVNALVNRLNEIRDMDKSGLSRIEKKELRNEVNSTKAVLRENASGGVYISGVALLLLIILLIVLL